MPEHPLRIIAYCLMPNHYHFLIEIDADAALSPFIQRLVNNYTQAFNRQQNRTGTLFEGRAKSKMIVEDSYVLHLVRYIHLNPVHAGLVKDPADWAYSNYLEWVGQRAGMLFDPEFFNNLFSTPQEYQEFVHESISPEVHKTMAKYIFD